MIHFRNRQLIHDLPIATETSNHLPKSLDTNLVCMFSQPSSQCPDLVEDLKTRLERELLVSEPEYSKYYNFPSCSSESSDWADRYWGDNMDSLLRQVSISVSQSRVQTMGAYSNMKSLIDIVSIFSPPNSLK